MTFSSGDAKGSNYSFIGDLGRLNGLYKTYLSGCIGEIIAIHSSLTDENTSHIHQYRKNNLILIMTPEKQDKTLELSNHWSVDSTPARNEVIMKRTYPVKSVKCDKICSNY